MKKVSFLCLLTYAVAGSLKADERTPAPEMEALEVVFRIERPKDKPASESWKAMVENVALTASRCQNCTTEEFDDVVEATCECVKQMGSHMKNDPNVHGSMTITLRDNEEGIQGAVKRR